MQCKCPTLWDGKIDDTRKCTILQPQRCAFKDYLKIVGVRDLIAHKCIENRRRSTTVLRLDGMNYRCLVFLFGLVSTFGEAVA